MFSIPDGRLVRAERVSGIGMNRVERPAYRSDDGKLALDIAYADRAVESLAVRDAAGMVLWTHRLGVRDKLARGSLCCHVATAAFSLDKALVAIAYFDIVYVYDARSGEEIVVVQGPTRARVDGSLLWWNLIAR